MIPKRLPTTAGFAVLLFALLCAAATGGAGEHLKAGDKIPDVTILDIEGKAVKLREAVASKPAVLIFYRGGWCPFCMRHLSALTKIDEDLREAGYQLLAISTDQPSKLKETPNRDQLTYTLLSDHTMKAADAFGISFRVPDQLFDKYKNGYGIDLEAASGKKHHKLPHPAVFVVSSDGTIRFAHVDPDYKNRLDPQKILAAARKARK